MALARVQYEQKVSGNKNFTVPMPYISRDHIKVSVDGVDVPFSWLNDSTIQLHTAPPLGAIIYVRRETERNVLLVDFQDASTLTEYQLDLLGKQSFYLVQEADDLAVESNSLARTAAEVAQAADEKADQAVETSNTAYGVVNEALGNSEVAVSLANAAFIRSAEAAASAQAANEAAQAAAEDASTVTQIAAQIEDTVEQLLEDIQDITGGDLTDFARNSENLSGLTDKAAARSALGLGTAATRDVTTSWTDATLGRVLKVGDFGVGHTIWINQWENLNDFITPGEYLQSTNANAIPELNYPVQLAGFLKVARTTGNGFVQEYTTYGSTRRKFLRGRNDDGSWSSWVEFYNTGNIAQLISDGNLVQTSRTISTGTGLTGGGNLSANRTISLANSHIPIGVGQTWQNVKGQRAWATTYTNTTGRPIAVYISAKSNIEYISIFLTIDGLSFQGPSFLVEDGLARATGIFAIIPPGSEYTAVSNQPLDSWFELR